MRSPSTSAVLPPITAARRSCPQARRSPPRDRSERGQANGRTGQLTLLGYLGPNAGVVLFSAVVLANYQPLLDAPLSRR